MTTDDAEQIARRYDKSDNNCKLRNILLTVLAKTNDAQLLIELKSSRFAAIYMKNVIFTAVATLGVVVASM
jgi:hypothetical protein